MAFKGWYSKQDVIKDLSKATGTYVSDLDEAYVIVGEQPPPLCTADNEENLQLLRLYGGHQPSSPNYTDIVKPDLEGITQMLRMVDEYNDSPVNNSAKETNKQHTNSVITISKLNPNVAEFVPRNIDNDICNNDNAIVANNELVVSDIVEGNDNHRTSGNKSTEACNGRSTNTLSNKSISIKDSDEIKQMSEILKSKITDTFNASCVKVKRERNLAIAMLVKLHTQPNNDGQKPKLMTPDYFKTSLNHDAKLSDSDISSVTNKDIDMCKVTKDDLLTNTKQSDDIMERESPVHDNLNDSNNLVMTKEIKDSIQKVDNWLNPKVNDLNRTSAITRPSVYLGPICFKRKNKFKSMSPVSVVSELRKQNSIESNEVFVPSTFASELTKKYEERNRIKESQVKSTNQDIWTKLESDLKVRDEIIKKKRLQTNPD